MKTYVYNRLDKHYCDRRSYIFPVFYVKSRHFPYYRDIRLSSALASVQALSLLNTPVFASRSALGNWVGVLRIVEKTWTPSGIQGRQVLRQRRSRVGPFRCERARKYISGCSKAWDCGKVREASKRAFEPTWRRRR